MYGKEAFITAFKVSTVQGDEQSTAGPYIAHLESQYSWAQARTLPHSKGSRPTGMEAPRTYPRGNLQSEDCQLLRRNPIADEDSWRIIQLAC